MIEVSRSLGRPAKMFEQEPVIHDDLVPYFNAYIELKSRASSFSGSITWTDLGTYHTHVAPHLRIDLLMDVVALLEPEDNELREHKRGPRNPKRRRP